MITNYGCSTSPAGDYMLRLAICVGDIVGWLQDW